MAGLVPAIHVFGILKLDGSPRSSADRRKGPRRIANGGVAQLVEQRNHNPCVGGSSPSSATRHNLLI